MKAKAYLNWSSGKDAAYALQLLANSKEYAIETLVTTVNSDFNRVSMHGVRHELLRRQAQALGLPLKTIILNGQVSLNAYNSVMANAVSKLKDDNYTHSVFGDIFLEDLKAYREQQLNSVPMSGVFPLWMKDTKTLAKDIISSGIKAITVCVNANVLDASFCGRSYDTSFLNDLPTDVDPCGENGEFHTFVYNSPMFKQKVDFKLGDVVNRTYTPSTNGDNCHKKETTWDTSFWYADLLPN